MAIGTRLKATPGNLRAARLITAQRLITRATSAPTGFVLPFQLYDKQLAPENDDWRIRLFLAGRFAGKTVSGSAWGAVKAAVGCPGGEGVLVGPTFRDVRQTMVEGPSGILKALGGENGPWVTKYNRSQFEIDLVNGSKILMRSADKLEGIRGMNLSWFWADEIGSWPYPEVWHEELQLALRIGDHPQGMATTTPRRTPLMLDLWDRVLAEDPAIILQTATAFDNPFIADSVKEEVRKLYEGTVLFDQEVLGKMVLAVEGAIWQLGDIRHDPNASEIIRNGGIRKCVVAVDPTSQTDGLGDDYGIIVVAIDRKGIIWVLADRTLRGGDNWKTTDGQDVKLQGPAHGAREVVKAFNDVYTEADIRPHAVVFEGSGNIEGYARDLFGRLAPSLPIEYVTPAKSKGDRARAVLPLWQNGTVRHLGPFPLLEDEMTTWCPEESKWSPNRIDSLVHGVAHLKPPERLLTDVGWDDDRLSGYGR